MRRARRFDTAQSPVWRRMGLAGCGLQVLGDVKTSSNTKIGCDESNSDGMAKLVASVATAPYQDLLESCGPCG